jgi:DNA-binding transcriptional MerR regulator
MTLEELQSELAKQDAKRRRVAQNQRQDARYRPPVRRPVVLPYAAPPVLSPVAGSTDEYLSTADLVAKAGVSRKTIRRYVRRGLLPAPLKGPATSGHGLVCKWPVAAVERLATIRRLRAENLTLEQAKTQLGCELTRPESLQRQVEDILGHFVAGSYLWPNGVSVQPTMRFRELVRTEMPDDPRYRDQVDRALDDDQLLRLTVSHYARNERAVLVVGPMSMSVWPDYTLACRLIDWPGAFVIPLWPPLKAVLMEWGVTPPVKTWVLPAGKCWIRNGDARFEREFDVLGTPR